MPLALLAFLKTNWLSVGMGVVIALLLVWVGVLKLEVGHYQHAAAKWEQAYNETINYYKSRETMLNDAAKLITKQHQDTLKDYNKVLKQRNDLLLERIKRNEELRRTKLSLDAVRLFNESKRDPNSQEPTRTEQGNDGKTNTAQVPPGTELSLADLFAVSAENDTNHWACIKQVEEWQTFWTSYKTAVEAANTNARPS